eukprot:TRINITY_DN5997_c0_g1_i1.p1 TRINITY_DN5997_c0_g1~~TRINITY_DN5997_c0_g1_i1.p1  ORF type:complete len:729 (-),score=208.58 TRINITY_DN5997_c0_g1_i1:182-2338(-)
MEKNVAANLLLLQSRVKKDPVDYREEFLEQHQHFLSAYEIFRLKPTKENKEFVALVKFLSAVAPCYPQELKNFPTQIAELLEQNALTLTPELRKVLVQSLILLRNRNLLSATALLSLFFKLFRVPDKPLRELLRSHIVGDIRRSNKKKVNQELNRTLQNFMYTMMQDTSSVAPRESLGVMVQLYRKGVWTNDKTVNVIASGIFHPDSKLVGMTINFFLTNVMEKDEDEQDKEEPMTRKQIQMQFSGKLKRKTKSNQRKMRKLLRESANERRKRLREEVNDERQYNYKAVMQLHDAQAYSEKLLAALRRSPHAFEVKAKLMAFLSRLIACHKLSLPSFYSYMIKYTQPHQKYIPQLLKFLAESVHNLVSPTEVEPVIRHIANTFVVDRRPDEVIAIGLNTIREICLRAPLAMDDHPELLKDFVMYKKHKDKGIQMAAKSIITLFQALNPELLPRSDKGRGHQDVVPLKFGEKMVSERDDTAMNLLQKYGDDLDLDEMSSEDMFLSLSGSEYESGASSSEEESDEDKEDSGMDESEGESGDDWEAVDVVLKDEDGETVWNGDDGEVEDGDEAPELVPADKPIDQTRILTDEDWAKLRYLKQKHDAQGTGRMKARKRKLQELRETDVDMDALVGPQKRSKRNYEERLETVLAGREEHKRKFEFGRKRVGGSRTNREKTKNKPYAMMRQKAMSKLTRSSGQKNKVKAAHVEKAKQQRLKKQR